MLQNNLGLKGLVSLEDWQKVQDSFAEVLRVSLQTIGPDNSPLSKISSPSRLWTNILPHTPKHSKLCGNCVLRKNSKKKINVKDVSTIKCPFDLDLLIIPIKALENRIVAYIVMGPLILNKRKDRSEYVELAKKAGVDPEELLDSLIEINVFSYNKTRSMVKLLSDMFSHMAKTGYHKKRLGEIGQEVIEMDPLFSRQYEEKVLRALLSTCTSALDIDSGSVMTVDKKTQHLHIKAASRLNKSFVNRSNIKMGEGIAGIAAATQKPIILPRDMNKNGLAGRMKRKYIKSSMIVPFGKTDNQNAYGVISLNVVRKNKDFSKKDIAFVKELVNLAGIALLPVK